MIRGWSGELRQANKESGCGLALLSSSTDFCRSQGFANRASLAPGYCQFSAIKAARHRSLLLLVCIARKNRSTHFIACFVTDTLFESIVSYAAHNKNVINKNSFTIYMKKLLVDWNKNIYWPAASTFIWI